MKGFIRVIFLGGIVVVAVWLIHQEVDERRCKSSGFDRMRNGLCVYHSRYVNLDYVTEPQRAEIWISEVRRFEEDHHRQGRRSL